MIFSSLKYLQPTNYFSLARTKGNFVFPKADQLSLSVLDSLTRDDFYTSRLAKDYDLSWQAIQSGYVGDVATYTTFEKLPAIDEYRFLNKNFSKFWVFYVLLFRIFSLKNPFIELYSFFKVLKTRRITYSKQSIPYEDYQNFQSSFITQTPLVSVIIPTLNRYPYLKDVLMDLEKQTYKNFEVIVVDQTEPFKENFYDDWQLDIKFWYQQEKALWRARNEAIQSSKGEYVLLYDDDSLIEENWIFEHLKALDYFKADISSGVSLSVLGAKVPDMYSFFKISDQIDTGNVLIKKNVFRKIGLFDRQFEKQRMGDGEFGLRTFLAGFKNISNPFAKRVHLKVGTGGLRQMGSWDGFRPKKWLDPRPIPSVLYLFRKYFGNKNTIYSLLRTIPQSIVPYKFKRNKSIIIFSYFTLLIVWPLVLFQIWKSWQLASVKLMEGDLIEEIIYK